MVSSSKAGTTPQTYLDYIKDAENDREVVDALVVEFMLRKDGPAGAAAARVNAHKALRKSVDEGRIRIEPLTGTRCRVFMMDAAGVEFPMVIHTKRGGIVAFRTERGTLRERKEAEHRLALQQGAGVAREYRARRQMAEGREPPSIDGA